MYTKLFTFFITRTIQLHDTQLGRKGKQVDSCGNSRAVETPQGGARGDSAPARGKRTVFPSFPLLFPDLSLYPCVHYIKPKKRTTFVWKVVLLV